MTPSYQKLNTRLLGSKKFRAALIGAFSSVIMFLSVKFGFGLTIEEVSVLVGAILTPILMYISAEGKSEVEAKRVVEENKARKEITQDVMNQIISEKKDN